MDETLSGEISVSTSISSRPEVAEYATPFGAYMKLVPEGDILVLLERQIEGTLDFLRGVNEAEAATRHAPYTWSVKEVVSELFGTAHAIASNAPSASRRRGGTLRCPGVEPTEDHLALARERSRVTGM